MYGSTGLSVLRDPRRVGVQVVGRGRQGDVTPAYRPRHGVQIPEIDGPELEPGLRRAVQERSQATSIAVQENHLLHLFLNQEVVGAGATL